MLAHGLKPLAPGFPVSQLALLGSEPDGPQTSFANLRAALERAERSDDPQLLTAYQAVMRRAAAVANGDHEQLADAARLRTLAEQNNVGERESIPLGKAIMIAGPKWKGTFDLSSASAQRVFELQFARTFAHLSSRFPDLQARAHTS
jgi:hypothetical protein